MVLWEPASREASTCQEGNLWAHTRDLSILQHCHYWAKEARVVGTTGDHPLLISCNISLNQSVLPFLVWRILLQGATLSRGVIHVSPAESFNTMNFWGHCGSKSWFYGSPYMSFVGNIVLPKVLNFCSNCKLPLTQPHPSDWKSWLLFSKKNKTENPSKDALDRTENYAKCKLCQLWPDWPGWLHDRDDQTNRSDQTDEGDQTDQCDQGHQRGGARTAKHAKLTFSSFDEWARESVSDDHQCKRCWRIWKDFYCHLW